MRNMLIVLSLVAATAPLRAEPMSAAAFVEAVEQAHGEAAWDRQPAFTCTMTVQFMGTTVIDGTVTFDTPVGKTRIDQRGGTSLVFDGKDAWVSPADAAFDNARFHVLTWPYFAAAPFKLDDPGATVTVEKARMLAGKPHPTARLTFDPGTGDAPDDWYLLYLDPDTRRLAAMAYIVTYGKGPDAARDATAKIITYHDFADVEGATLPMTWRFHAWDEAAGATGEPVGEVKVNDAAFIDPKPETFLRPTDSREDKLPTTAE